MNYFILDKNLKTVAIAQTDSSSRNAFHVLEDSFVEYSNAPSTLELTLDFYNEKALEVKEGAHVVFQYEGVHRLFQIKQVEEQHAADSYVKLYAEESSYELLDAVVFAKDYTSVSAEYLLGIALADTDWQIGEVSPVTLEKYSFTAYNTALSQVQQLATDTECMLRFRIKFSPQKGVTGKYVDLLEKVTIDEGKRLEFGRNVDSVKRIVDRTGVCTAVIPVGSNDLLVSGFDWVNHYEDKTISKVKDLYYLEVDEETRSEINPNSDHHLFYVLQVESDDKSTLCQKAYEHLKDHKEPKYTYEVASIFFNNESYAIGEQVRIIDDELGVSMVAEVEEKSISFCDPDSNTIQLTNYIERASNISQILYNIQNKLQTSVLDNPLIIVSPDKPSDDSTGSIWIDTSGASTGEIILNQYFNGTWIPTLNSGNVGEVVDGVIDEKMEESEKSLQIYVDEKTKGIEVLKGTTRPNTAIEGQLFINSNNGNIYQFVNGQWHQLTDMDAIDTALANHQQVQAELEAVASELQTKANNLEAKATELDNKTNELNTKANELIAKAGELENATNSLDTRLDKTEEQIKLTATKTEVQSMIDGIQIGGSNIIRNSNFAKEHDHWTQVGEFDYENSIDGCAAKITAIAGGEVVKSQTLEGVKADTTYTFSGWYKTENFVRNGYAAYHISYFTEDWTWVNETCLFSIPSGTQDWERVTHTFTMPSGISIATISMYVTDCTGTIWFDQLQLEEGSTVTSWSPNPKDTSDDLAQLDARVTEAEASIGVNAEQIALKVDNTTYQTDKANMQANINANSTAIEQNAEQISLRATKTEVNTAIDNIEIGGRNLWKGSGKCEPIGHFATGTTVNSHEIIEDVSVPSGCALKYNYTSTDIANKVGTYALGSSVTIGNLDTTKTYTLSVYLKTSIDTVIENVSWEGGMTVLDKNFEYKSTVVTANKWHRFWVKFIPHNPNKNTCFYVNPTKTGTFEYFVSSYKLEEGNHLTAWTPAPEDIEGEVGALATRVSSAETSITQNANEIALRATKTEVTNAVNNIEIGGTNLIVKSKSLVFGEYNAGGWTRIGEEDGFGVLSATPNNNWIEHTMLWYIDPLVKNLKTKYVTVSAEIKSNSFVADMGKIAFNIGLYKVLSGSSYSRAAEISQPVFSTSGYYNISDRVDGTWVKVSRTFQIPNSGAWLLTDPEAGAKYAYGLQVKLTKDSGTSTNAFYLRKPKVELGNKATDWSPAPEDTQEQLDAHTQRITTAESSITQNANNIALKVSQSTYDTDRGVNKWQVSRYDISMERVAPTLEMLQGKSPNATYTIDDNTVLQIDDGNANNYYIGHFFTNVYVDADKSVACNVGHDDGGTIYINGAKVYSDSATYSSTSQAVTLNFKKGWNTIDILLHEISGGDKFLINRKLSTQVTKMMYNNGINTPDSSRVKHAETSITQNAEQIQLRATKTEAQNYATNAVNNLNIGGTNIVRDGDLSSDTDFWDYDSAHCSYNFSKGYLEIYRHTVTGSRAFNSQLSSKNRLLLPDDLAGSTYTLSAEVKALDGYILSGASSLFYRVNTPDVSQNFQELAINMPSDLTSTWRKVSATFTFGNYNFTSAQVSLAFSDNNNVGVCIRNIKLEKGNKATDYSPCPTDMESRISSAETSITQNANEIALRATKTEMEKAIDDIEIGGRNLIIKNKVTAGNWLNTDGSNSAGTGYFTTDFIAVDSNQDYVLQVVYNSPTNSRIVEYDVNKAFIKQTSNTDGFLHPITTASNTKYVKVAFKGNSNNLSNLTGVMFEKGNKPTAYRPAPEDLETRVSSAETSITQNADQIQLRATKTEMTNAINNIQIGGTNLFGYKKGVTYNGITNISRIVMDSANRGYKIIFDAAQNTTGGIVGRIQKLGFNGAGTFTFSADVKATNNIKVNFDICDKGNIGFDLTSEYQRVVITQDVTNYCTSADYNGFVDVTNISAVPSGTTIYISNVKIEKGNKATAWSPAPEDIDSRLTSAETSITTNANEIALRATKTELTNSINNIKVGGRNLLTKDNLGATGVSVTNTDYVKSFTKTDQYGGLFIQSNVYPLELNKYYVLSYKIRKTAGTLKNIGGHTDTTYVISKATLDGVGISYTSSTNTSSTLNDGNFHEVIVYFSMTSIGNEKLYIQPNRGDTTSVTVEIKDWQLEEGTHKTSWSPNPDDVLTRLKTAETSITTNAEQIALRATKTEMTTNINNAVNNIKVGGTNLFKESSRWTALPTNAWVSNANGGIALDTSTKYLGYNTLKTTVGNGIAYNNHTFFEVDPSKTYTYSAMVKCSETNAGTSNTPLHFHCANNSTDSGNTAGAEIIKYDQSVVANEWKLIYLTIKPKGAWFRAYFYIGSGTRTYNIAYLKFEEGNKPTDWTPNPDDTTSQMNSLSTRISSNSTAITTNANEIALRAKSTEVTTNINNAVNNIKIGGTNLIKYGKGNEQRGFFQNFDIVNDEEGYGEKTMSSTKTYTNFSISDGFVYKCREYPVGKQITWSFDIMFTQWSNVTKLGEWWVGQRYGGLPSGQTGTGAWNRVTQVNMPIVGQNGVELNKWYHFEHTMTIAEQASDNISTVEGSLQFYNNDDTTTATVTFRMKNVKLEFGNKATDFSVSSEEVNEQLINIESRLQNAEIKIEDDSIVATVLESQSFTTATEDFVVSDDIKDMATKEDVTSGINGIDFAKKIDERISEQISDDASALSQAYVTQSQMTQTKNDIDMNFINAGGINLIRNSLGFNGVNDGNWTTGGCNIVEGLGTGNWKLDHVYSEDKANCTIDTTNNRITYVPTSTGVLRIVSPQLKPKTTYTWSFTVWTTGSDTLVQTGNWMRKDDGSGNAASFNGGVQHSIGTSAIRCYHTFTTTANVTTDTLHINDLVAGNTYYFTNIQLQESYIASDYRRYTADGDDSNYFVTGYDSDAEQIGFDSAIMMPKGSGRNKNVAQAFPTILGETYTVSFYVKKTTTASPFYYAVRSGTTVKTDPVTPTNVSYGNNGNITTLTDGYQFVSFNFVANSSISILKFNVGLNDDVSLTGIMVNRGSLPLAHTFARGEVYNTNINFDMNGIKVTQLDSNGNPSGYTIMSPSEFAGYYDTDGDGSYEKIFYLNQDAVVSKRSVATHEIIMGKLKFINLDDDTYKGWALVPSTVNDWAITEGTDS